MADDAGKTPAASRLLYATIRQWRDSLINLSGSNRLLNFRVTRAGAVRVMGPAGAEVLAGLNSGRHFWFLPTVEADEGVEEVAGTSRLALPAADSKAPQPGARASKAAKSPRVDLLQTDKPIADLAGALRNLMRRSNQEFLDRGVWILYLSFGSLTWTDGDKTRYTSPLLLVPVRLVPTGARQMPYLERADEDAVVNPALTLKLSQLMVTLTPVDDVEELGYADFLSAVRDTVSDHPGWRVNDEVTLSYFSFVKEAMYRDLLDNESSIAGHPVVQALATGGRGSGRAASSSRNCPRIGSTVICRQSRFRWCWMPIRRSGPPWPPRSQGRSFVMDGPPGTGKSQTIANMIGALLHAGKRVLFVSEKAAALEVVRNRLHDVGLSAYLLELHSHKATRKEVASALGQALETVPIAPGGMSDLDRNNAQRRREELNAYAEAMNRPRAPLNYSLHDVLGLIANLHEVPAAPLSGKASADLTVEMFGSVRETAAALARAWRPAAQGRSFVWRGVRQRGSLDAQLYAAGSALDALAGITAPHAELAAAFGSAGCTRRPTSHALSPTSPCGPKMSRSAG